jgi:hypothetical protein
LAPIGDSVCGFGEFGEFGVGVGDDRRFEVGANPRLVEQFQYWD